LHITPRNMGALPTLDFQCLIWPPTGWAGLTKLSLLQALPALLSGRKWGSGLANILHARHRNWLHLNWDQLRPKCSTYLLATTMRILKESTFILTRAVTCTSWRRRLPATLWAVGDITPGACLFTPWLTPAETEWKKTLALLRRWICRTGNFFCMLRWGNSICHMTWMAIGDYGYSAPVACKI
jgi:hypothetical protein